MMAKGDLEKYLELSIKECDTLKNAANGYKDLELYGAIRNELDKVLVLLRREGVPELKVQELHGGNDELEWNAELGEYQFMIRRILDKDIYELYLCDKQNPSYMKRIHGKLKTLQDALDKIREEYQGGMLP